MTKPRQLAVVFPDGRRDMYFLAPGSFHIGRDADNDIVLMDRKVSRRHARLDCTADECRVTDLGSVGGTLVNQRPLTEPLALCDGDKLRLGDCTLWFQAPDCPAPADEMMETCIEAGVEPKLAEDGADLQTTALVTQSVLHCVADTQEPRLVIYGLGATRAVALQEERVTIGREPGNTVVIDDYRVSRWHAQLQRQGRRFLLKDLGSTNGTWVGDHRIDQVYLTHGEAVRIGGACLIYKAGSHILDAPTEEPPSGKTEPIIRGRRPVVVLPGIMGSELYLGQERLWPCLMNAGRSMQLGKMPDQGLRPGRICQSIVIIPNFIKLSSYADLGRFLQESLGYQAGQDLLEFPYDWRQDNRQSARALAEAIDQWKQKVLGRGAKVVLIAHSMGSLVSRYYVECLGGADHVERLIMLGGPHAGSVSTVQSILHGPQLLPLGLGAKTFQQTLITFPSIYQLTPHYPVAVDARGRPLDLWEQDDWVHPQYRHLLHDAAAFHRELRGRSSVPALCIFGYGLKTMVKIIVDARDSSGWQKVRFVSEPCGDGTVVEKSALLDGAEMHPVQQYHGALWTDPDVMMRLKLELMR